MSSTKFSTEQLRAIESRNKNIILSAQAGAGKSTVLVERIIRLLEENYKNNINIDNFLVVTFTNKAASELKTKIKRALKNKIDDLSNNSKNSELVKYFQNQINRTTNAQISTMHSFCINIIREYFYKLNINPKFKILLNSNLEILKWETINKVFSDLYENEDREFFELLNEYSDKYSDDHLIRDIILKIYTFIQSQIDPLGWLEDKINKYKLKGEYDVTSIKEFEKSLIESKKNKIRKELEEIKYLINNAKNKIQSDFEEVYLDVLEKDLEYITIVENRLSSLEFNQFVKTGFELGRANSKFKIEDKELRKSYKENLIDPYRDKFKELFSDIEIDLEYIINKEDEMKKKLLTIFRIISNFDRLYKESKLKRNSLEFNDVEHLLIKLMKDEEVLYTLKNRFKYILFDEYQDANQIQDCIIDTLSSGNNLFFVGDIKQSIYKFRLSDPLLFKNRYEKYKKREDSLALDLTQNFRSERKLLNFTNFIFNNLMTDELGDVKYDTVEHRLKPGKDDYSDDSAFIKFSLIDTKGETIDEVIDIDPFEKSIEREFKKYNIEAFQVARKIKELSSLNGVEYKDIVALSRNNSLIPQIQSILDVMGIPSYSDFNKFSYEDIELKVLIEILKAIDSDIDDITLLSVLTSTLVHFKDVELAKIRGENKENSFNHCFRNYSNRKDADSEILEKISKYESKISEYRILQNQMNLSDFIWYVLLDSGHYSYVLSKKNGNKILENINVFLDEVKDFESESFQTLNSFLSYIDKMLERRFSEQEASAELSEEDNVVRLMTIHKSKGLEFKHVILYNLSTKFNFKDLNDPIIFNDFEGIALKDFNREERSFSKGNYYQEIEEVKKKELVSEEIRLLYVAFTRAIESITFISKINNSKSINKLEDSKNYINWIFSILFGFENDIDNVKIPNELINILDTSDIEIISSIELEGYSKNLLNNINSDNSILEKVDFDFDLLKIDQIYDYSKSEVPYKKSVTKIAQSNNDFIIEEMFEENEEISLLNNLPNSLKKDGDEVKVNTEIGTIYHLVMEKLPANVSNIDDVNNYLDSLVLNNLISSADRKVVNPKLINNFTKQELYKRIHNSKNINKERSFTMYYKIPENENVEYLVDGQIDLFFEEDGELVILDYKTNRKIDENYYSKQLHLYKNGLELATGKKVKEMLIYWILHDRVSKIK